MVSPSASSSGPLTLDLLNQICFPEVGDENGKLTQSCGLLLGVFSGHHDQMFKDFTALHYLLKWLIMDGGLTPKCQPLDAMINKIWKGFF